MADTIRIKRRAAGGAAGAPSSLAASELAYNEQDDVLYYGKGNSAGAATTIIPIGGPGAFAPIGGGGGGGGVKYTFSSTAPSSPTAGDLWYDPDAGLISIYVNDGSSSQWIQIGGGAPLTFTGLVSEPQGRLTLVSGTPVMTTTQAAKNQVFYTGYCGSLVPIYDGSSYTMQSIGSELSQLTTDATKSPAATAANSNYDLFVWNDAGTRRCTRGPAWSTDIVRGTGAGTTEHIRIGGYLLNANAITNGPAAQRGTYVGTIRTNASNLVDFIFGSSANNGGQGWIGVWNAYNRVPITMAVIDTTASWAYGNAAYRSLHNSTTNRVSLVVGLQEDGWSATYAGIAVASASGVGIRSIGVNSTTVATAPSGYSVIVSQATASYSSLVLTPAVGWHYLQALELASAGSVTFWGSGWLEVHGRC